MRWNVSNDARKLRWNVSNDARKLRWNVSNNARKLRWNVSNNARKLRWNVSNDARKLRWNVSNDARKLTGTNLFLMQILMQLTHCGLVMPHGNRSGSTLVQVMACCLTAPSHYLKQCWLIISEVWWQSPPGNYPRDTSAINYQTLFEHYLPKFSFKSPMSQRVKNAIKTNQGYIYH